jgi:phosphoribosylglycinamide formyltransferase-1
MRNIAIFASGNGTNCENIIRYFRDSKDVHIQLVLSNKVDAGALKKAQQLNIKTIVVSKVEFNDPQYLLSLLQQENIEFIVLAGFLLMIPDFLIKKFHHRMLNLHPALLPKYGGKGMYGRHVHEAVKAAGEKETGMTVHWVNSICDGGDIIAQYKIPINSQDTVDDIATKEHELEIKYFPEIINKMIKNI